MSAEWLVYELEKRKASFKVTHHECIKDGECIMQFVKYYTRDGGTAYKKGFVIGVNKDTCKVCFVVEVTEGSEDDYDLIEESVKPDKCGSGEILKRFEKFCLDADCCDKPTTAIESE